MTLSSAFTHSPLGLLCKDLNSQPGWGTGARRCDMVINMASHFPLGTHCKASPGGLQCRSPAVWSGHEHSAKPCVSAFQGSPLTACGAGAWRCASRWGCGAPPTAAAS